MINKFATKICNQRRTINRYKKQSKDRKHILTKHGLFKHNNLKNNKISPTGTWRTVNKLKECVNTLNNQIHDDIDLKQKYLLSEFKNNPQIFNVIKPQMEKIWIQEQTAITKDIATNDEYAIRIALTGVINSWTQRQWNSFNSSVKKYIIYIFVFVFIFVIKIHLYMQLQLIMLQLQM